MRTQYGMRCIYVFTCEFINSKTNFRLTDCSQSSHKISKFESYTKDVKSKRNNSGKL